VTDLDTLLPDRLRHLADEQAPVPDLVAHAASARGRFRRQRRTRIAVTGLAAAVAAIVVGVPVAMQSLLSAPADHVTATLVTTTPAEETQAEETATEAIPPAAPRTAETPTAPQPAPETATTSERTLEPPADPAAHAELARAAALLGPSLAVKDVPESDQCAHLESGPIAHLMGMDLHLYTQEDTSLPVLIHRTDPAYKGKSMSSMRGCRYVIVPPTGPGVPGLHLGVSRMPWAVDTDPLHTCLSVDVPSSAAGAVLRRCPAPGAVQWWVQVPMTNGDVYFVEVTVEDTWTGIPGPEVVARFAGVLALTSW